LQEILKQLGGDIRGSIPDLVDKIIDRMASLDRPLIIDESDYLVDKKMVDLVREIHDKTLAPIILIGEENLPLKLKKLERFHNRILHWQHAEPLLLDEMRLLNNSYSKDVEISDDLLAHVYKYIDKRTRRAVVNIALINEQAKKQGLTSIDLKAWGNRALFTGQPTLRGAK
jgi:DNA transposition AAA+ family ATPase